MEILKGHPCDARNFKRGRKGRVEYLVIHYVGALGSALANVRYYGGSKVGASAHLYVDHGPDAAVYESVALGDTAWHCGAKKYVHPKCRNESSIGIELCCHKTASGKWYFDPETVAAGAELTRELMAQFGLDGAHVLRHFDVTGKNCPAPFVEDAAAWEDFKNRLEGEDMTREEVQMMIDAAKPKVYTELADVPKWAQPLVKEAQVRGILKGDGTGKLSLTAADLKTLSMVMAALKGGRVM